MRKFTFSGRVVARTLLSALLGCSFSLGLLATAQAGVKTITIPNSTATALISDHLLSLDQYERVTYQLPANTLVFADNHSFVYFKLVDKTAATQFLQQLPALGQGFKTQVKPNNVIEPSVIPNPYENYFNRSSLVGTLDSTVYRSIMAELELYKPNNQLLLDANFPLQDSEVAQASEQQASQDATTEGDTSVARSNLEQVDNSSLEENCAMTQQEHPTQETQATNLTLGAQVQQVTVAVVSDCIVNGQAVVPVDPPATAPAGTKAAVSKYPPVQPALPVQPTPLPTNEQMGGTQGVTNQPAIAPALPVQPTPIPGNEYQYNDIETDAEFAQLQAKFATYNPSTSLTLLSEVDYQLYTLYEQYQQAHTQQASQEVPSTDSNPEGVAATQESVQVVSSAQEQEQANAPSLQMAGQDATQIEQLPVDLAPQPELSDLTLQYLGSRDYSLPEFNQTLFNTWLNPQMRSALEQDIFGTQLVHLQNFTTPEYRLVAINGVPAIRVDSHVLNITREYRGKYQFQHAVIMDYSPTQYLMGVYYYYGDQIEARDVTFGVELFLNSIRAK